MKILKPQLDRIIVRRISNEETIRNGIIIPEMAREKLNEGEIIDVGPGRMSEYGALIPMTLKPGQHVLFGKFAGNEIKIDGQEYLLMRSEEVGLVIEDDGKGGEVVTGSELAASVGAISEDPQDKRRFAHLLGKDSPEAGVIAGEPIEPAVMLETVREKLPYITGSDPDGAEPRSDVERADAHKCQSGE